MTNTVGMGDPGATGRFGEFGGRYVPETLIPACEELEVAFRDAWVDPAFRSELDALLARAAAKGVFGTKMRSVIKLADPAGVGAVVDQQFAVGREIVAAGLVPIIEPEIDIHSPE